MIKTLFAKTWNKSKQPRKQRKFLANAPLHTRSAFMNSNLSPELRKKHGTRSIRVRKNDKVKIMRGKFKGHEGKVDRVNIKRTVVYVTGVEISKRDGSKAFPAMKPSNLMILDLNTDDKKRIAKLTGIQKIESVEKVEKVKKIVKAEKVTKKVEQKEESQ